MRINIIPIRELIIPIIPIRFRIANTNRTNLFLMITSFVVKNKTDSRKGMKICPRVRLKYASDRKNEIEFFVQRLRCSNIFVPLH